MDRDEVFPEDEEEDGEDEDDTDYDVVQPEALEGAGKKFILIFFLIFLKNLKTFFQINLEIYFLNLI